jgi:hypothetical protein
LVIDAVRSHRSARNPKQGLRRVGEDETGRLGGLVRRTTDRLLGNVGVNGTYQKLGGGGRDALVEDKLMGDESRGNISEVGLVEQNENGRDGGKRESLVHDPYQALGEEESRYEPIRHHHQSVET